MKWALLWFTGLLFTSFAGSFSIFFDSQLFSSLFNFCDIAVLRATFFEPLHSFLIASASLFNKAIIACFASQYFLFSGESHSLNSLGWHYDLIPRVDHLKVYILWSCSIVHMSRFEIYAFNPSLIYPDNFIIISNLIYCSFSNQPSTELFFKSLLAPHAFILLSPKLPPPLFLRRSGIPKNFNTTSIIHISVTGRLVFAKEKS